MVDWKANWKQAKKDFEKEAGDKKPGEKWFGFYRKGSGLTNAFAAMDKAHGQLVRLKGAKKETFAKGLVIFGKTISKAERLATKYEAILKRQANNEPKVEPFIDILTDAIDENLKQAKSMAQHLVDSRAANMGDVTQATSASADTDDRDKRVSTKVATASRLTAKKDPTGPDKSDLTRWRRSVRKAYAALSKQLDSDGNKMISELSSLQQELLKASQAIQKASTSGKPKEDMKKVTNVFWNMGTSAPFLPDGGVQRIADAVEALETFVDERLANPG